MLLLFCSFENDHDISGNQLIGVHYVVWSHFALGGSSSPRRTCKASTYLLIIPYLIGSMQYLNSVYVVDNEIVWGFKHTQGFEVLKWLL